MIGRHPVPEEEGGPFDFDEEVEALFDACRRWCETAGIKGEEEGQRQGQLARLAYWDRFLEVANEKP